MLANQLLDAQRAGAGELAQRPVRARAWHRAARAPARRAAPAAAGTCGNCALARPGERDAEREQAAEFLRLTLRMEENAGAGRIIRHESMTDVAEEIGELIVALLPRLRRFARSLSRNQHDADDLAQVAVERALRNREQFRAGASLASWMFGIMKNAWLDDRRARARRGETALPEDSGEHPAVSPDETNTNLWSVSEAMSKLPEDQRLAIALVLVEGLSYKEAAEVLEIPIGTLTSRLARGRTALAAALGRYRRELRRRDPDGLRGRRARRGADAPRSPPPSSRIRQLARRVRAASRTARRGRGRFRHGARPAASRTPGAAPR